MSERATQSPLAEAASLTGHGPGVVKVLWLFGGGNGAVTKVV